MTSSRSDRLYWRIDTDGPTGRTPTLRHKLAVVGLMVERGRRRRRRSARADPAPCGRPSISRSKRLPFRRDHRGALPSLPSAEREAAGHEARSFVHAERRLLGRMDARTDSGFELKEIYVAAPVVRAQRRRPRFNVEPASLLRHHRACGSTHPRVQHGLMAAGRGGGRGRRGRVPDRPPGSRQAGLRGGRRVSHSMPTRSTCAATAPSPSTASPSTCCSGT